MLIKQLYISATFLAESFQVNSEALFNDKFDEVLDQAGVSVEKRGEPYTLFITSSVDNEFIKNSPSNYSKFKILPFGIVMPEFIIFFPNQEF